MGIEEKLKEVKFDPLFRILDVDKLPESIQEQVKGWIREGTLYALGALDAVYAPLDPSLNLSSVHPSWTHMAQGKIPKKGTVRLGYDQRSFDRSMERLKGLYDQVSQAPADVRDKALAKVGLGIDWGMMLLRRFYPVDVHQFRILKGAKRYSNDYDSVQKMSRLFKGK